MKKRSTSSGTGGEVYRGVDTVAGIADSTDGGVGGDGCVASPLLTGEGADDLDYAHPVDASRTISMSSQQGEDDLEWVDEQPEGNASLAGCVVNQANTIIGAGMLSFPKALAGCGLLLGGAFILFFATLSIIDQFLLASLARKYGRPSSFKKITVGAGLAHVAWLVDVSVVLVSLGACIAYLMIAGETLSLIVRNGMSDDDPDSMWTNREVWVVLCTLFVTPLSCLKRLDALAATSGIAMGFVLFIAGLVAVTAFGVGLDHACGRDGDDTDDACSGDREWVILAPSTVSALSVFTFGYNCQQNVFSTQHNELAKPTPGRAHTVATTAVGGATVMYLFVSIGGYIAFGPNVESDVLDSFVGTSAAVTIARVGISFVVLFSYPVVLHSTRSSCFNLLDSFLAMMGFAPPDTGRQSQSQSLSLNDGVGDSGRGGHETGRPAIAKEPPQRLHVILMMVLLSSCVALLFKNLDVVLGLAGATGATMICYIIPGYCYAASFKHPHLMRKVAWAQLIFGLIIGPSSVVIILLDAANLL